MNIVQVLNQFLPKRIAGTEIYTWALCRRLKHNRINVSVIIPNYGKAINEEYYFDSINVKLFAESSVKNRSLIMGKSIPFGVSSFKAIIEKEKLDILHFHELAGSDGISIHHIKAAKELGAKIVMTFHLAGYTCRSGNLIYKNKELCDGRILIGRCSRCYLHSVGYGRIATLLVPFSQLLMKIGLDPTNISNRIGTALGTSVITKKLRDDFDTLISHCDKVVVITDWYRKVLIQNGVDPMKITVIKQGLPVESMAKVNESYKVGKKPIRLVFLGRISRFKGLHLLIEALLSFSDDEILLDIYGQATDSDYFKTCRELSANKTNIRWKEIIPQSIVVMTLRDYDALCLCSTFSEMSPLVIQEAFAAGIPVIASKVYGNMEGITHNFNGLLFNFNDSNSLKEQLRRCIDDPALLSCLSKNIEPVKSFDEVANEYISLYEGLMKA